jgi:tape measure domain-containing protein
MAEYNINFSTNASQIAKELGKVQTELAKAVQMAKPGGLKIQLSLDASGLEESINTTFRKINKAIESNQRKLSQLQIGGANFRMIAERLGTAEGQRERGRAIAEPIKLRAQAAAFEPGSLTSMQKVLQALRIEASQITPNTVEWVRFQQQIGQVTLELKQADKAAESIQLTEQLGALAPGSLSRLEKQLTILKNSAREITPKTVEWKKLNKEIQNVETSIAKLSKKPLTMKQRAGAAGGAFLYGGGMGGGAGSALGGIAGGLMGGVPGAFTGAAVGQAVDDLTTMTAAMTDQAAAISKLQMGLATASNDLTDFALATREVDSIATRLQLPLAEVYRKFTQLRSSTVALGIDTKTTGQIFEGTAAAVLKSGGSMDDVSGAMRAVVQVFSKGKLTAEELRGQLGERLPGAVVEFAKSSGRSVQDLDAAFEAGGLTLDEFVTFLREKAKESGDFVDEMGQRSEYAGARMAKAFETMQLNIGMSLQPAGAAIQDFITRSINGFDLLIRKAIEFKLIQPGADFYVGQALAGENGGIAGLENQLLATAEAEASARDLASQGGLGFLADLLPQVRATAKEAKILEEALTKIRNLEKLTKQRKIDQETQGKKDKAADTMLGAIEKREEAILGARKQREEDIAQIRKKAVEDAKRIEEDFNRQRLEKEREIGAIRRELAGVKTDTGFALEAANIAASGGDPEIVRNQQVLAEASRRRNEEKIQAEQQILDEQTARTKAIEDLKFQTADAINEANTRYTKAIGKAQEGYARSVAKIIDEGAGKAGKRLAAAGRLAAAYLSQATAKEAFSAATGKSIISAGDNYMVDEQIYSKEALISAAGATSKPAGNAARDFVKSTGEIQKATQALNILSAGTSSSSNYTAQFSVSVTDLTNKLGGQNRALEALGRTSRAVSEELADAEYFKTFVELGTKEIEEMAGAMKNLKTELEKGTGVRYFRQKGMKPEQAEQAYTLTRDYTDRLTRVSATAKAAMAEAEEAGKPEQAAEILETYKGMAQTMRSSYDSAMLFSQAINNLPIEIRLEDSIQDIGDKLSDLMDPVNQIKGAAGAIGDAFGTAFKGVIAGSMTAQEALAGMFRSISDHFADMVAQMIAEYLKMQLIEGIMNIFSMLAPGFGTGIAPGPVAKSAGVKFSATKMGPAFANGGVASGGFTAFANGGMVTGPTLGLVGEGRYNEAIIPLPDGKSVPVQLSGSAGGNAAPINTSIVVNVKNGQAESQMSGNQGNQLARELEGAVRQVILKESRPGGLISSSR